ncbi:aromatic acid exporter family protein [Ferviditalea candida]|uniref:Aromatic acid exporter family protein n=1 Tax=Ferviditalea candida TaxID=3108399 RepID=A0ABU5ZJT3_9BACL|nr:aromatic acid exporter family protein [Paenibacillaceae bacterium T2]
MGIRVIKTAIAAVLAIYLAQLFSLSFEVSSGLLAILGVDVTRRKGLRSALQRIAASILGLLFGSFIFWLLGFHVWVFGIIVLISYPLLSRMQLKDGIVTSSVIILHIFSIGKIELHSLVNEVLLLLTGLGSATLINFVYMPNPDQRLLELRSQTEESFSAIFRHIAENLKDKDYIWGGSELIAADASIRDGIHLSGTVAENALFKTDEYWMQYFLMRRQQLDSIQRMMLLVSRVYETLPHGKMTAELFEALSKDVKQEEYMGNVENMISDLEGTFKILDLPRTREEFEVRSAILQLFLELKGFISIAKSGKKKKIPA